MSSVFLENHLYAIWSKVFCHFPCMDQDISLSQPLYGQQIQLLKTIPIIQSLTTYDVVGEVPLNTFNCFYLGDLAGVPDWATVF